MRKIEIDYKEKRHFKVGPMKTNKKNTVATQ